MPIILNPSDISCLLGRSREIRIGKAAMLEKSGSQAGIFLASAGRGILK
jgi:hypothetical protein